MATFFAPLASLESYHLIAWGSLLGTAMYQSFVVTKLCYLHLPRPQFTTLQKRVFPVYFALQTVLAAATAATYPSGSLQRLVGNTPDVAILGTTFGISVVNWLVFGPRASQAMVERTHQETRDRRSHKDVEGTPSDEMKAAKRRFSHNHAMTIHLNLLAITGTLLYGVRLGSRLA